MLSIRALYGFIQLLYIMDVATMRTFQNQNTTQITVARAWLCIGGYCSSPIARMIAANPILV